MLLILFLLAACGKTGITGKQENTTAVSRDQLEQMLTGHLAVGVATSIQPWQHSEQRDLPISQTVVVSPADGLQTSGTGQQSASGAR